MSGHQPPSSLASSTNIPSYIPRRISVSSGSGNGLNRSGGSSTAAAAASLLSPTGLPQPSSMMAPPASTRTLGKRTSLQAGLSTPSTVKRPASALSHASNIPSTPSLSLSSLKADLQASSSAGALQRQLNSSQRENGTLLRELGSLQERVRNLEKERTILLAREEKALSKDVEKANRQEEQLREMTAALKEFRSRCNSLEEENEGLLSRANKATHEAEMAVESQQATMNQMNVLQEELEKVDEENQRLKDSKEALQAANERIAGLEKEVKAPAEVTRPAADSGTTDVLRKELHHQVTHLRSLEHANARLTREISALKKDKANAELLKEEKLAWESKLRNMGTLRSKLAQVESENSALLKEKNEWAIFLRDTSQQPDMESSPGAGTPFKKQPSDRYSSPASVTKALASARITNLSLEEKVGYLSSLTKVRDGQIQELESRITELEEEVVPGLEKQKEEVSRKLEVLERNQALDAKELQMLKEQVDTYATEESSLLVSGAGEAASQTAFDQQKTLQIAHLQELLDAHKAEASRNAKEAERLRGMLEARGDETREIDASLLSPTYPSNGSMMPPTPSKRKDDVSKSLSEQVRQNEELRENLRTTQTSLAEAELELESLDAQLDVLHHALGRGEYNVNTTKVVSLGENPAAMDLAIRTETLERLKEENRILLERLTELEKATSDNVQKHSPAAAASLSLGAGSEAAEESDSVPRATYTNLVAENESLQAKIEQAEKSRTRLKEIFARTAQDLRDACRSLFGYKIEPLDGGRMKVTTVFGGSDYALVFGPGPADKEKEKGAAAYRAKFELVGGNDNFVRSERVQTGVNFWIAERQCVPGFLSTLTMELFEESTRGRTSGWTEAE